MKLFYPLLHLLSAVVYLYLAIYIFSKNPKERLNRIVTAFLLCFSLWSFCFIVVHHPSASKETAMLFVDISALGWVSFSSFFLWFILTLTGKDRPLEKKWLHPLIFGIPIVMFLAQWLDHAIFSDLVKMYYGWKGVYNGFAWPGVFFAYYLSFMVLGIYLGARFIRETENHVMARQIRVILVSMTIVLALGTLSDVILPIMKIYTLPNIADVTVMIYAFAVVYAIVRYKFLVITPAAAAKNILETMHDCLLLLDPSGAVTTANKATLELSGYTATELIGVPIKKLFTASEPTPETDITALLLGEKELQNKDLLLLTKYGKQIPVLFSKSVLKSDTDSPGGMVCVAKDISERKRLELELFNSKKMESIGILAGGIAHDFNNLLAVIIGNIGLARDLEPLDKKTDRYLEIAQKMSEKAAALAGKFITFSPGGWPDKKEISLHQLLEQIEKPGQENNRIRYRFKTPADLPSIHGDETQLKQVLLDLFLNGSEAMPNGGDISVQADTAKMGKDNEWLLKEGEYVKIRVTDTGAGISPEHLEKVFDPYFSTKRSTQREGTGLGLAICNSIIKKHDGLINVESKEGDGATVTLYLPASGR